MAKQLQKDVVLRLVQVAKVLGYETRVVYEGNTPAFCQILTYKERKEYLDRYTEFNPWTNTGILVEMQYRVAHLYGRFEFRDLGDGYKILVPKGAYSFEVYVGGTPQDCFMDILIEHGKKKGII